MSVFWTACALALGAGAAARPDPAIIDRGRKRLHHKPPLGKPDLGAYEFGR